MVNFQSITQNFKQSVINMEYSWKKPASFVVLIPGISLIFQKIQNDALINTLKDKYRNGLKVSRFLSSDEMAKLETLHTWHVVGNLIQFVASLILANMHPLGWASATIAFCGFSFSCLGLAQENIFCKVMGYA